MATVIRKVELNHVGPGMRRVLKDTLALFRSACGFIGEVVYAHWDSISAEPEPQRRLNAVEALIHKTKENPSPSYPEFDRMYYKFPSYIRRAAVNFAIGQVSSYYTRLAEYNEEKHKAMSAGKTFRTRPPKRNFQTNAFPALYKGQSWKQAGKRIFLKVYMGRTWRWVEAAIPERDRKCLRKANARGKMLNPTLVFAHHGFYLHFPFRIKCADFPDTSLANQVVLGCDLGINHGAVCSAVDAKGKVHYRAFDPFHKERDGILLLLEKIRHTQRKSGPQRLPSLYTKLDGVKGNYVRQLARWIVDQAIAVGAYGIVLEHLGNMKARGAHKDRIHHWCKAKIRDLVKGMALREGIRVFTINPRNTSALAFDGSGKITRNSNNFSLCTFANGKQYSCDLSASYNIAARYFLRAMEKAMSSEAWEQLRAEVPELVKRTNCTLSSLWKASISLEAMAA